MARTCLVLLSLVPNQSDLALVLQRAVQAIEMALGEMVLARDEAFEIHPLT